jgi:hypothetical protein
VYTRVRKIFPKFIADEPKYKDIENVRRFLEEADLIIDFKSSAQSASVSA